MPAPDQPTEAETILMALDQLSQTIDVMTSVVNRLRHYVHQQQAAGDQAQALTADLGPDQVIH